MCLFVCLCCAFVWWFVYLCPSLFIWLVGCLCLCVLACFLAPWATFWFRSGTLWGLVASLWHLGDLGTPLWHLGAPVGHAWGTLWRLFGTLGDLGGPLGHPWAPFGHPWAPFGHPWAPFWCTFSTLGRGPGPLWALWGKRREKGTKNNRKWEPKYIHVRCDFEFSWKVANSGLRLRTPNAHRGTSFHPWALPFEHLVLASIFH